MGDRTNIFDILSEPEGKQKKQKQKKQAADEKKNQGNKPNANAGKKKDAPVAQAQQGQGRQQGRAVDRAEGRSRSRGGEGRGGARGAGRGGARGGARGGNQGAEGRVRGERESHAPHRGDVGRDFSRRNREQQFNKGDYGSKRPMDKFSHSSAARSGAGKEKKAGHGARNWGAKDVTVDDVAPAEEEKVEAGAEQAENVEGDNEAARSAEAEGKEEEVEEEEEPEVDYETFLERKKKEDDELKKLVDVEVRKVDASEFDGLKVLAKREEEEGFGNGGKKKSGKKNSRAGKVNQVDEVLNVQAAQAPRERDNRSRGRGRGQSDRPRQNKRNVNLSLQDDADFPSLTVKG